MQNEQKDVALKMPTPAEVGGASQNTALTTLLVNSLKGMLWAEMELVKMLPQMAEMATTPGLKLAILEHLEQTKTHVKRVEEAFGFCGSSPAPEVCEAMEGLLTEGQRVVDETEPGSMTRDAAIVMAAQKVEHYEIASYGNLAEFARTLGIKEVVGLMDATLEEEKMADHGLSIIAESGINWSAEHEVESPGGQKATPAIV